MEKYILIKTFNVITIVLGMIIIFSCGSHSSIGRYTYYGTKNWVLLCCLNLKGNSIFDYQYFIEVGGMHTSGTWEERADTIILNSTIQSTMVFPVDIKCVKKNIYRDKVILILKNINWRDYDWNCIAGNDTIKIENDTLFLITQLDSVGFCLIAQPKSPHILQQLSIPDNSFVLSPPLNKCVKSMYYEIKNGCQYLVVCDSSFGNNPLTYKVFKNRILIKEKNRILDQKTRFPLRRVFPLFRICDSK